MCMILFLSIKTRGGVRKFFFRLAHYLSGSVTRFFWHFLFNESNPYGLRENKVVRETIITCLSEAKMHGWIYEEKKMLKNLA